MAGDFQKISMTAKFTAYMRQYSDIPFAKDVAKYIRADEALDALFIEQEAHFDAFMWYAPMLEMRYKSIARLIRKSGVKQVLELASGLSLRGLAMTEDPEFIYVESDLEALTQEKKALVSMLYEKYDLVRSGNHYLTIANAMDLDQLLNAAQPFNKEQPIAIICEGLLPYLSVDERDVIAKNICGLLKEYGAVWITPDFTLKQYAQGRSEQQKKFHQLIAEATGRMIWDSAFESVDAMQTFFKNNELNAQVFQQIEIAPHLVSEQALNESSRAFWEKVQSVLRVWMLSL